MCLRIRHVTASKHVRSHAMCDVLFCGFAPLTPPKFLSARTSFTYATDSQDCRRLYVKMWIFMNIKYATSCTAEALKMPMQLFFGQLVFLFSSLTWVI